MQKTYKVGKVTLTLKPFEISSINEAVKLFDQLDNAKDQFCGNINWALINPYEKRNKDLQTAYMQVKNLIPNLEGKELAKQKKYLKELEASILKLERDIVTNEEVTREYEKKAEKENLGAVEYYSREGNLKKIFEMTCEGDIDSIDFSAEQFFNLMKIAGEIQVDFFSKFGLMKKA